MTKNERERDAYNQKYADLVLTKLTSFLQEICPDEKMEKTDGEPADGFWDRLQMQYNIIAMDYFEYKTILDFCVQKGFKRVYDIGGANGFANFIIKEERLPLEYIVVDKTPKNEVLAPQIAENYPIKIDATPEDVLISHLCMGIMYEPHKNREMFNRAISDFDHIILHTNTTECHALNELFPNETLSANAEYAIQYFDTASHKQLSPAPQIELSK